MGEGQRMTWVTSTTSRSATIARALACALALSFADAAGAVSLADGVQAYEDMDLDVAANKLVKALRTSAPKDKPRVELWLAIVELERGNEATARRWLKSALRADPTLTVEHELSPKVVAAIEAVRAQVKSASSSSSSSSPAASTAASSAAPPAVAAGGAPLPSAAAPDAPAALAPSVAAASASASATVPGALVAPVAGAGAGAGAGDTAPAVALHLAEPATTASPSSVPPQTSSLGPADRVSADGVGANGSSMSPLVYVTAATGAVSAGALVGGAVLGTVARIGGEAAEREPVAAIATERYQEASTAAFTANSLFIAGGVAAVASVVCGVLVFVDRADAVDSDVVGDAQ